MTIFVGNLSHELSAEELRREFTAFGEVTFVTIIRDTYGGQPNVYGFVEMPSKSEGKAAIADLEGKTLKGRTLNVIEALPLSRQHKLQMLQRQESQQI